MQTSIIMTAHIQTPMQAHMTMAAIANVTRYTPEDEYEFILMDADNKFPVRDDYHVLKIDNHVYTKLGYTASMNEGARLAMGDILVFMQNDVFVWEGWLPKLRWYIDNHFADAMFPDQCPRDRKFVEQSYLLDDISAMKFGSRDAGLLMITKEAFAKTGGWNKDLSLLAEKDFYERMGKAGVTYKDTCKVLITHIMAATNLDLLNTNLEEYNRRMDHDAKNTR